MAVQKLNCSGSSKSTLTRTTEAVIHAVLGVVHQLGIDYSDFRATVSTQKLEMHGVECILGTCLCLLSSPVENLKRSKDIIY